MAIADIITLGFGTFSSVPDVLFRGYTQQPFISIQDFHRPFVAAPIADTLIGSAAPIADTLLGVPVATADERTQFGKDQVT